MLSSGPCTQRGISLIEVVVGMAILAIAMMLGLPSFNEWIQNAQIRTAAESLVSGLQQARSEAVRRNAHVIFIANGNGTPGVTGWQVILRNSGAVLQAQIDGQGSRNATVTPNNQQITFNGMGRVLERNPDGTNPITQIEVDNPKLSAEEKRNLRITINAGGEIRLCDPKVTDNSDPRSC
ncbi:GspH/FimT family pseudopilin [Azovibrio restrictus]|uniref:GspH/FimT family pseudopilin n=1 Tax=Azovibrio restrictus TaxID=146938 RepID=UPI0026EC659B|nr:GspH/FimT family pseudopilin [Azovibrio restrictus]